MEIEFTDEVKEERKELINEVLKDIFNSYLPKNPIINDITIRVNSNTAFGFEVNNFKVINCSCITIECIWALSYVYWIIYTNYVSGKSCNRQGIAFSEIDYKNIKELMEWCNEYISYKSINEIDVPKSIPKIEKELFIDTDNKVALEFTRMIVLYFLMHEVGHLAIPKDFESQFEEEEFCDKYAIDSILDGCKPDDYFKRAIGIACGLCMLNVDYINKGGVISKTHPYGYDRLINNLEYYVSPDILQDSVETKIWGYIVVILSFHISNSKSKISNLPGEYSTFYSCVLAYREHFKKY